MRAAALVAALAALAAAGCGGGGGERLSRDDFVAKADAICAGALADERKLAAPTAISDIPGYVDKALPIVDHTISRLRELRPPAEIQSQVDDWLGKATQARGQLNTLRSAARTGEEATVHTAAATETGLGEQRDAAARQLGLTSCASL